jgi:hypothetical protein
MKILYNIVCKLKLTWIEIQFKLDVIKMKWFVFEFTSISIEKKGMQTMEKILKICLWIWCWEKQLKHRFERT